MPIFLRRCLSTVSAAFCGFTAAACARWPRTPARSSASCFPAECLEGRSAVLHARAMKSHDSASAFYDALAPYYHLIFDDWNASISWQGTALDSLIKSFAPSAGNSLLDVSCGIGTQSLALAARGYDVTASD